MPDDTILDIGPQQQLQMLSQLRYDPMAEGNPFQGTANVEVIQHFAKMSPLERHCGWINGKTIRTNC